jgi:uncharacterized protein
MDPTGDQSERADQHDRPHAERSPAGRRQEGGGPTFQVHEEELTAADVLLAGFSEYGLAGLTAVDYIVDQFELEYRGHVTTPDLPTITPFDQGTPRHPIRLFGDEDRSIAVLVGELQVPLPAARSFSGALLEWTGSADIGEIAVLSGVPMAHTESDHRTYYVATEDYQRTRLDDADVPPMGSGFTDGVKASLLSQGMDSALRVCVYTTPAHPQTPDVPAALRMLETVDEVYNLGLDTGPLEDFAADVERYYTELAEHMERSREEQQPEDRMYM